MTTTATRVPQAAPKRQPSTPQERGRTLGTEGYGISESVYCRNHFFVHKPGATRPYSVDMREGSCNCPASRVCKHLEFVKICLRRVAYLRSLEADVAEARAQMIEARRRDRLVEEAECRYEARVCRLAMAVGLVGYECGLRVGGGFAA